MELRCADDRRRATVSNDMTSTLLGDTGQLPARVDRLLRAAPRGTAGEWSASPRPLLALGAIPVMAERLVK